MKLYKIKLNLNLDIFVQYFQTLLSAQTLSQYPGSKITQENLDMFADSWESQINDLSIMVKEINDVCQGRGEKPVYLSLPRPGVRLLHRDLALWCIHTLIVYILTECGGNFAVKLIDESLITWMTWPFHLQWRWTNIL